MSETKENNFSRNTIKSSICKTIGIILIVALISALFISIFSKEKVDNSNSKLGAIVSNAKECAPIGRDIIEEGGSAVDSIIATLLCEGAIHPHTSGIGGGFIATIYNRERNIVESLVSREMAPSLAHSHMFDNTSDILGSTDIAIPGEIKGFWEMHQKYGKLPWRRLFEPTIKLLSEGFHISVFLGRNIPTEGYSENKPFRDIYLNPVTGLPRPIGDIIRQPQLAETLRMISEHGADILYGGELGEMLVRDIQNLGGIISVDDLKNYKVKWTNPTKVNFMNYTVYSSPLPGGGAVLSLILNLIKNKLTSDKPLLWHRLIESYKHAYGRRTLLGDVDKEPHVQHIFEQMINPDYAHKLLHLIDDERTFDNASYYGARFTAKEDHGTTSLSVVHPNGDAVSITSTINMHFGSMIISPSTGILLNNNMDDFSAPNKTNYYNYPPSPSNFIKPYKRPLSSMCPTIIVDGNGDVKMTVGATGGSKIPTSVALVIIRYLFLNDSIYDAIEQPRFHHQLLPNVLKYEEKIDSSLLEELRKKGHSHQEPSEGLDGFASVTGIGAKGGTPKPVYDNRRGGIGLNVRPDTISKF